MNIKSENAEIKLRPRQKMLDRLLSIIKLYQVVQRDKKYIEEGAVEDKHDEIRWDKDEINIKLVTVEEPQTETPSTG